MALGVAPDWVLTASRVFLAETRCRGERTRISVGSKNEQKERGKKKKAHVSRLFATSVLVRVTLSHTDDDSGRLCCACAERGRYGERRKVEFARFCRAPPPWPSFQKANPACLAARFSSGLDRGGGPTFPFWRSCCWRPFLRVCACLPAAFASRPAGPAELSVAAKVARRVGRSVSAQEELLEELRLFPALFASSPSFSSPHLSFYGRCRPRPLVSVRAFVRLLRLCRGAGSRSHPSAAAAARCHAGVRLGPLQLTITWACVWRRPLRHT